MSLSYDDGCRPERTSLSAILYDLQACISEPARIFQYWTRNLVRRLWKLAGETGTDGETVDAAFKGRGTGTGTAGKESPPADDGHESNPDDESHRLVVSYDEDEDEDEEEEEEAFPPSYSICYDGVSYRLFLAYSISRYLVELLAVRPRFPFEGTVVAWDYRSTYYSSSERGHTDSNLDSQGNLILHSDDFALEDGFSIDIKCLDRDYGFFSFRLDPFHCNNIITHTIRTTRSRQIELTFIPLHNAIQANVYVKLDLPTGSATSSSGTIYYVYGEITAHHKLYGRESVMLFSCRKENPVEVIDGKLPLPRNWTAVPIYLEPVLIVKLNLCVATNCDHGDEGRSFSFQGDITFYRDDRKKYIRTADEGMLEVQISYR